MGTTLDDGFMAIIEAVTAGCSNFRYSRTQIVIFLPTEFHFQYWLQAVFRIVAFITVYYERRF